MEDGPTGDDDLQSRAGSEQVGHDRGRIGEALEVVEDEQHSLRVEELDELLERWLVPALEDADGTGDGARDERGSSTGSSGTKNVPSGWSWPTAAASSSANRVLPIPPGPVDVSTA